MYCKKVLLLNFIELFHFCCNISWYNFKFFLQRGTFALFVFIPCLVAKAAGSTRSDSTTLVTETLASPLVGSRWGQVSHMFSNIWKYIYKIFVCMCKYIYSHCSWSDIISWISNSYIFFITCLYIYIYIYP